MGGGLEEDEVAIDLVDRIPDMPIRDGHMVADFVAHISLQIILPPTPALLCPPRRAGRSRRVV